MTLAGLCSLAICAHMLGDEAFADDPGVARAVAWLGAHWCVEKNPESGGYNFYYLYSLERAGRILDREALAGREWYPPGVLHLLATQRPDGSWEDLPGGENARHATSFALLFLTRATAQLAVPLKHGGSGTLHTALKPPPGARFYIVLDASGSMLETSGGRSRFDQARDSVAALVATLPAGSQVALRAYGHRRRATEEGAEQDTELLLPMQPLDQAAVLAKLRGLRARGKTPLAQSLREARDDLRSGAGADVQTIVLLLTDGGEDSQPRQDPVAAARQLAELPGMQVHVVGYEIRRDDWKVQLHAIAAAAAGRFWPAGGDHVDADLQAAVLLAPARFEVRDAGGAVVATGRFGAKVALPEGEYRLVTQFDGRDYAASFWINTDATTAVLFDGSQALAVTGGG